MDQATFQANFDLLCRQHSATAPRFDLSETRIFQLLDDDVRPPEFDAHYVYHTAWAARRLAVIAPAEHVDFASSIYFVAIASAMVPFRSMEYQPSSFAMAGVEPGRADLTNLPFDSHSLPSVSCMHVVEHIGLGRYGDAIDYDGDAKAMAELARVVAPGGSLLFVVPVGRPRIVYNAHRIYSYRHVMEAFGRSFSLENFALLTDQGTFLAQASTAEADAQVYGCGCFHLIKQRTDASPADGWLPGW